VVGTHSNKNDLDRRLKLWFQYNFSKDGSYVLADFFEQEKIDHIKIKLDFDMKKDPVKSMKIFVERNGKFQNYQSKESDEEASRLAEQEREFER